ncbi:PKD domain-containing protein (plasmid) [Haloferax mediterranei ATCC 33500]|uniref:Chitinase n=1 Tax=Haloferax mediterranei (strain ATCC 33500 / DSM 1411 / JCM 8866 / NBRC 14739 / NCIMB 2177 / R-4) TaxID=523841 RepID=I3R9G3_HALMT|nr:PKD domain-containing protein [Haloferax mediterranei]AFK20873.1 chitinase [Haloferax mediterranei ATCC 33500]AHZ24258.1 chitinase [Haloferax mediterranei ATCC 33500]EMA05337.1 chitinase [Haloferax mediterranei ATCC 33500]MDX5989861.1 PKD domain-containing protein [Haloferax mediterranei ATCC 33500]QCQ77302.1 PKD domain-containing protein [Haloferax mediterranei ATCC 33500]
MTQNRRTYLRNVSALVTSVAGVGAASTAVSAESPPKWDETTLYEKGDRVTYEGYIWEADIASRNAEPSTDSAYWTKVGPDDGGDDESLTAAFTIDDATVTPGTSVSFDASESTGTVDTYDWSFTDGASASGKTVSHSFESTGSYGVKLTVTGSDGATDTTDKTVTVESSDGGGTPTGSLPSNVFAPYDHVSTNSETAPIDHAKKAGTNYFHLAFVLAGPDGKPAWDGDSNQLVGESSVGGYIDDIHAAGGEVIIAFGGAAGPYLADGTDDPAVLADHFETVVDAYGATHLDIDEEAFAMSTVKRRNEALAMLQERRPEVSVSFTLPTSTKGLTAQGKDVLQDAIDKGVTIDTVNIMTMNYGWVEPSGDIVTQSASNLHDDLGTLFPDKSAGERWSMVGITPMIGVNNVGGKFTQADAKQVLTFAQDNDIGLLSFWSIDRDNGTGSGEVSPVKSGIDQEPYEFSSIFAPFTSE